jgi:hypothetical protein
MSDSSSGRYTARIVAELNGLDGAPNRPSVYQAIWSTMTANRASARSGLSSKRVEPTAHGSSASPEYIERARTGLCAYHRQPQFAAVKLTNIPARQY